MFEWWPGTELNCRHYDFQSYALPTELPGRRSRETARGSSSLYQTSLMDATSREVLWGQFGAAIDMLENAIRACPDALWSDRARTPEFWYLAYHTLFFLDLYLHDAVNGFAPPAPFTLDELDPSGVMPDRVYAKRELLSYLEHGRHLARTRIAALSAETAVQRCRYGWKDVTHLESLLSNMRHVQHHTAQLNLLLRQSTDSAPEWVTTSRSTLSGE
jgi:hypothetical protein